MIAVDTRRGIVLRNDLLKTEISTRQPYGDWLSAGRVQLELPDVAGHTRFRPSPVTEPRVAPNRILQRSLCSERAATPPKTCD
jgi:hypothetical protein